MLIAFSRGINQVLSIKRRVDRRLDNNRMGNGTAGNGHDGFADLANDPLAEIIKNADPNKRHPSPSQIRGYRGQETVIPFIFTDAVYFRAPPRRTGEPAILHFSNTEGRPAFYGLEFANDDPDQIIQIYTHDLSEDELSGGYPRTVSSSYAVARIVGEMFGEEHHKAHLGITNIRGVITHQLEDRLKDKRRFTQTDVGDVVNAVKFIQSRLKRRNYADQTRAYAIVKENVESYSEAIANFEGWSPNDRTEAADIADKILQAIKRLSSDLMPTAEVHAIVQPYLSEFMTYPIQTTDNTIALVKDPMSILRPHCWPVKDESPLVHMINHFQYGEDRSYISDLFDYARSQSSANPKAALLPSTKGQEAADNARKEAQMTIGIQHQTYERNLDLLVAANEYLRESASAQNPLAARDTLVFDFTKMQLLMRVVKDYSHAAVEPDRDYKNHRIWLVSQYGRINRFVSERVEAQLMREIDRKSGSNVESDRFFAEIFLRTKEHLDEIVGRESHEPPRKGWLAAWLRHPKMF